MLLKKIIHEGKEYESHYVNPINGRRYGKYVISALDYIYISHSLGYITHGSFINISNYEVRRIYNNKEQTNGRSIQGNIHDYHLNDRHHGPGYIYGGIHLSEYRYYYCGISRERA